MNWKRFILVMASILAFASAATTAADDKTADVKPGTISSWLHTYMKLGQSSPTGDSFFSSLSMTIATELGDKTFCIAAVMAMRYNRMFVFAGAAFALLVMTVLSVGIGVAVPTLMPKTYTHYAAAALFAYFGFRLLREARDMKADNGHEELHETEAELGLKNNEEEVPSSAGDRRDETDGDNNSATAVVADGVSTATNRSGTASSSSSSVGNDVERGLEGSGGNTAASGGGSSGGGSGSGGGSSLSDDPASKSGKLKAVYSPTVAQFGSFATQIALFCRKDWGVLTQAFTLTFLAEWGDRSQIATIAMAAAQNPLGVCLGAFVGHSFCTGLAVVGGRLLASRISERTVAFLGAILFLLFAVHSLWVGPEADE